MPRTEARFTTSIWTDSPDVVGLTPDGKLVWFTVLTQPTLNLCGVISYTPAAWAKKTGLSKPAVVRGVREIHNTNIFHLDTDTEELWVRTLARHDKTLEKPYMVLRMAKDFITIQSPVIRGRFLDFLGEGFIHDSEVKFAKAFDKPGVQGFTKPFVDAFHERFPQ